MSYTTQSPAPTRCERCETAGLEWRIRVQWSVADFIELEVCGKCVDLIVAYWRRRRVDQDLPLEIMATPLSRV